MPCRCHKRTVNKSGRYSGNTVADFLRRTAIATPMAATNGRSKKPSMPDDPIIDLASDHYFMGEALRQATKAYEAEEVPIGAVIVRDFQIIARAFNQVE